MQSLQQLVLCVIVTATATCLGQAVRIETFAEHESVGCEANPTGNPIGGGKGYGDIHETGDFIVSNRKELASALQKAQPGQVIFVPHGVEIDLSGQSTLTIPAGVTLAGTRGKNGSPGARIFSTSPRFTMFATAGDDVRVTGLRIEGQYGGVERLALSGRFLRISHCNVQVDNCEVYNFSGHDAIGAGAGALHTYVHHNHMHHIQRGGLGYPVSVHRGGAAYIIGNHFDYGRHHIAGHGSPGEAYEAAWNLIGEHATSHHFDMHGGRDRGDGTDIAGDWIHIHHNTFQDAKRRHIAIRGTPSDGADIHNNWFARAAEQAVQSTGNTRVFGNVSGPDKTPQKHAFRFVNGKPVECTVKPCRYCP